MFKNKLSIYKFLLDHSKKKSVSFHMPGHKGGAFYKRFGYDDFFESFLNMDVTEIPGADNLFQREGIIRQCGEHYASLYDAKKSYLLINGTSGGIIASILATVPKGGSLIMARNSHKSVFNALTLGDISPIYAYPLLDQSYGISGPISAEEIDVLLKENPQALCVILPSPNYYGICSDIKGISEVVHSHGKILIVDEAHGAHLHFMNKELAAIDNGADLVINSTHKTLASMTQSAVLNVSHNSTVDLDILEDKLQAIQSTSPSYVLMASLDISASILQDHGDALFSNWKDNLESLYHNISTIPNLELIHSYMENNKELLDKTKINLSLRRAGISGPKLEELLISKFNIYPELVAGDLVMAMSGIGNTEEDFHKLAVALKEIQKNYNIKSNYDDNLELTALNIAVLSKKPKMKTIPQNRVKMPMERCGGKVCAQSIIPYPPGIPLACPGEVITEDLITYIKGLRQRGEKVIGVTADGEFFIGK